ncbi:class I SAM-dependent RNA methyltransferase [Eubacteriales bacterium OttesenSCG-928-N13]|nr:class I SAM-dependent RNA methyltransferase [Eubacteriales bacterium OttesenSCG-928-N13]
MDWIASAAFGLEGLVKRDLVRLGAQQVTVMNTGGVRFSGDVQAGFMANMWLRTADRVMLLIGEFEARSFEELYQGIRALPWQDYLPKDAAFPVRAQCARSQLMSPSDCQKITKKAIVDHLMDAYHVIHLPETGATFQLDVSIHQDRVTVAMDSSGAALSRRGYRTWNGEAPMRETLAAAVALSSPWRPSMAMHDPCCGTGTLLIESAFIALDRAPGLKRDFAMEGWPFVEKQDIARIRSEAEQRFAAGPERLMRITGSDIDPEAIELCKRHIVQAGLGGRIDLAVKDVRDLQLPRDAGMILTNPPYGARMGDRHVSQAVARQLGELMRRSPDWQLAAITADRSFEKAFGRRASKRRRLYNGRLECELMIFENHR